MYYVCKIFLNSILQRLAGFLEQSVTFSAPHELREHDNEHVELVIRALGFGGIKPEVACVLVVKHLHHHFHLKKIHSCMSLQQKMPLRKSLY